MFRLRRRTVRSLGSEELRRLKFLRGAAARWRCRAYHECGVVAIQHETGPAIAFAVEAAEAGGVGVEQAVPPGEGLVQPRAPPIRADGLGLAGVEDTDADGGIGIEQPGGEEFVIAIIDYPDSPVKPGRFWSRTLSANSHGWPARMMDSAAAVTRSRSRGVCLPDETDTDAMVTNTGQNARRLCEGRAAELQADCNSGGLVKIVA